jgi:hypothetical protein
VAGTGRPPALELGAASIHPRATILIPPHPHASLDVETPVALAAIRYGPAFRGHGDVPDTALLLPTLAETAYLYSAVLNPSVAGSAAIASGLDHGGLPLGREGICRGTPATALSICRSPPAAVKDPLATAGVSPVALY